MELKTGTEIHNPIALSDTHDDVTVHSKDSELRAACRNGETELAVRLILEGGKIFAKDKDGRTAMEYARRHGRWETLKMLEKIHKESFDKSSKYYADHDVQQIKLKVKREPIGAELKLALPHDRVVHGSNPVLKRDATSGPIAVARLAKRSNYQVMPCKWKCCNTILCILGGMIFVFFTWIVCDMSYESRFVYDQVFDYPPTTAFGQKIHRIGFVGDSLCLNDVYRRKVSLMLQAHHPNKIFMPIDACIGGSNVSYIRQRIPYDMLRISNVDAIFMLWGSDASDVYRYFPERRGAVPGYGNNHLLPPSAARQAAYINDLTWLILEFLKKTPNVVISGPTLYGEQRRGLNAMDAIYDTYTDINIRVCRDLNVTYLNLRELFFNSMPPNYTAPEHVVAKHFGGPGGILTEDGEHANDRGRDLILAEYFKELVKWWPGDDDVRQGEESTANERRDKAPLPKDYFSPSLFLV